MLNVFGSVAQFEREMMLERADELTSRALALDPDWTAIQDLNTFLLGDPPKRVVKRLVRSMPGHAVRCDYLAY